MNTVKPLAAEEHSWSDTGIYEQNGRRIALLSIRDEATEEDQDELEARMHADARRLVACWNRLLPLTTAQIEDDGFDLADTAEWVAREQELLRRANKMEQQCGQMLAALEAAKAPLEMYCAYGWSDRNGVIGKVDAAIAAAKGD